jgi:PPOX class probable F420-dependent enzyme
MFDLTTKVGRLTKKLLKSQYFIWLTTVDSTGTPQPRPVWFIWEDETILIFSQAKAHKIRHIEKNPNVSLHFNTADEKGENRVVILTGTARIDKEAPSANKLRSYMRKYKSGIAELNSTPEQFGREYSLAIRITPTNLRGWE